MRDLLTQWAHEQGYGLEIDKLGNMFVRREGTDRSLSHVLIGSHLDAGSARWVFADPRLPPGINNNVPKKIEYAPSVAAVALRGLASPILIYEREPTGRYVERFL